MLVSVLLQLCFFFKKKKHQHRRKNTNKFILKWECHYFMAKACSWVRWQIFFNFSFLFVKRKAFITQLFFPSFWGSLWRTFFFVRPSNQHIFIALPVPLKLENPGSRLVLYFLLSPPFFLSFFFLQGLAGIHRLKFIFSCSISGHRDGEEYRRRSGGGRAGWVTQLSATFKNISPLLSQ